MDRALSREREPRPPSARHSTRAQRSDPAPRSRAPGQGGPLLAALVRQNLALRQGAPNSELKRGRE
jgi:hypothetical protein